MRITAIIGSPHGMKGNTGTLLTAMVDAMIRTGAVVEVYSLSQMDVTPCRDCGFCHKAGECLGGDEFDIIKQAMIESDGIVFASPNYIWSVSAQLKSLMDRCCGFLHTQMLSGKYGAAVVTSGGGESEQVERYLLSFVNNLGCWAVGSVSAQAGQMHSEKAKAERLAAAAKLGEQFVDAIKHKKTYPEQVQARRQFAERMKALVTMRKAEWPYEYEFWQAMKTE